MENSPKIDLTVSHPLEHTFTLLYQEKPVRGDYIIWGGMEKVMDIDTIEKFWQMYNSIIKTNEIEVGEYLYFFKKDIEPTWEDPNHTNGGEFVLKFNKDKKLNNNNLNEVWMRCCLLIIGNICDNDEYITGVLAQTTKRDHKIKIWTKTTDEIIIRHIGSDIWRSVPMFNDDIFFKSFDIDTSGQKVNYKILRS